MQKSPDWLEQMLAQPTVSVPEAGRALGIGGRNQAYDAAARGELKVLKWGRSLRVPTSWIAAQLGLVKPPPEPSLEVLDRVEELIRIVQEREARQPKASERA